MSRKLVCLAVLATAFCAQLCAFQRIFPVRVDYHKPYSHLLAGIPNPPDDVAYGCFDGGSNADILVLENGDGGGTGSYFFTRVTAMGHSSHLPSSS